MPTAQLRGTALWGVLLCAGLPLVGCASREPAAPPPEAPGTHATAEAATATTTEAATEPTTDAPAASSESEWVTITLRVRNADATPASNVTLAGLWGRDGYFGEDDRGGRMVPVRRVHTAGAHGELELRVRRSRPHVTLMAYDDPQTSGALVMVEPGEVEGEHTTVEVTLQPLVTLKGSFHCEAIGGAPQWATNYVYVFGADGVPDIRVATCAVKEGAFEMKLPPGNYGLSHFGKEIVSLWNEVTLESGVHDLGRLEFAATALAASYGKPLPELSASGVYADGELPLLADFKGRWTFLIYWAYW